jgi:hypothetical protein
MVGRQTGKKMAGRPAGRPTCIQAGKRVFMHMHSGRRTGRQAGGRAFRHSGRQAGR